MLGLPQSTEFNKRIPKQKFYEHITVSPALKKSFVDQIRMIYWRNKVAATTVNLAPGTIVDEVEVFEIKLNSASLDEAVLRQIDREISYHIIFLLEYEGKLQAWTAYKEKTPTANAVFKVGKYYHTEWMTEAELPIRIDGLNLDAVYEKKKQLEKQIAALENKMRREKQLNRQMEMNAELKRLKREKEKLNDYD